MDLFFGESGRLRTGWRFCLGVMVFAAGEVAGNAAGAIFWRTHPLIAEAAIQALSVTILLGGYCFLLITADRVEERPLAAMGLGWGNGSGRQIAAGLGLGTAMVLVCVGVVVVNARDVSVHTVLSGASVMRTALVLLVLGLGAVAEESVFRGYPFQRLVEGAGPWVAMGIMSLFFGIVHGDNPDVSRWAVVNTVLFGVVLGFAYLGSRALWFPIGIHFAWNAVLAAGFGLPMSGLTLFASMVHTRVNAPHWATGGRYGIEGGGLATVVLTAAVPAAWWLAKRVAAAEPQAGESLAANEPAGSTDVSAPESI